MLAENPDKFFPTIKVGITIISILAGVIGVIILIMPFSDTIK
ncbi:MAG: hypothetical protein U1E54_02585 [Candidatus Levybacteria bacterium]|nr:hypothetical protein [Candidatus Levybacteria bacterium]